jgi:hypothetical protein
MKTGKKRIYSMSRAPKEISRLAERAEDLKPAQHQIIRADMALSSLAKTDEPTLYPFCDFLCPNQTFSF